MGPIPWTVLLGGTDGVASRSCGLKDCCCKGRKQREKKLPLYQLFLSPSNLTPVLPVGQTHQGLLPNGAEQEEGWGMDPRVHSRRLARGPTNNPCIIIGLLVRIKQSNHVSHLHSTTCLAHSVCSIDVGHFYYYFKFNYIIKVIKNYA